MTAMNRLMKVAVALVVTCSVGVTALAGATTVASKTPVASYALGKAKKCRVDYVKRTLSKTETVYVKDHGKWKAEKDKIRYIGCVYVAPSAATVTAPTTTTVAPTVTTNLAVHLDPSFVQSASNPLSVIYTASATASQTVGIEPAQEVASLPDGVLDFYSDGNLACSTNVGGSATTTQCPVTYTTLGEHTVITEYVSGTNSATETDVEDITGQGTTTTVAFSGDPTQGATTSTLTATVTSQLGTDTAINVGAITFNVDNAVLTTTQANQTTCTLDWTSGPTFSQSAIAYVASATSPDCTVTGTALTNITSFTYSASFTDPPGLSDSTSAVTTLSGWPQVPPVEYVNGSDYVVTWGAVTLVQLDTYQYSLATSVTTNAPEPVDYFVTVRDAEGVVLGTLGPDAGGNTQIINDYDPLPLSLTFTFTSVNGPQTTTWDGAQEIITTYGFSNTVISGTFND